MDGETLLMKDLPLIGIWLWHRYYEPCLDGDVVELRLVLKDCAMASSFNHPSPIVIAHLVHGVHELEFHPRVVYSIS